MNAIVAGRARNRLVLVLFLLSGATGLVYQVVWLRMLGLVFGHSVYAIATVLAAFMSGLGLGSFGFARRVAAIRNPIRAYGWLELGVGASCALVPLGLALAARLYLAIDESVGLSAGAFGALQFVLVFLLLLVPTTLMGGTLPVLSQALATDERRVGRTVARLYAVNTFGAVAGVIAAGYGLLPAVGNRATIAIAVAANLGIGALALALGRRAGEDARASAPAVEAEVAPAEGPRARLPVALTLGALAVSGAVSMVYEVAWTRALALVVGSSTYAFTAMLVAFLVGIAGGSAAWSWLVGDRRATPATFAALQAGIAVASIAALLLYERLPELFLAAFRWSRSPSFVELVQFAISASALLPFTLFLGATFPCAVAVASRGAARIGRDVGEVYAVNTLGAIAGTLAAGFGLIPRLGVHGALRAGVIVNLVLAAVLLAPFGAPRRRALRGALAAAALAGAAGAWLLPAWNPSVLAAGTAVYARAYVDASADKPLRELLRGHEVVFHRDGLNGTIAVTRSGEHVMLRINGKIDAGTDVDMHTQLMSGHLAMLLHPDPRRVLVIGLGSGVTAGAVARHPVEHLDIVEIEPAVYEAASFFAHVHGAVLDDPRVRPIVADARNFLMRSAERWDVIVSEPSNPWIGGIAALFTREFFELAREHLAPDGTMVQWVHGYSMHPDDLRLVVRTFRSAFPAATVWNTIRGDFILVGALEPRPLDLHALRERYRANRGLRADMARLGTPGWSAILGYFLLGEEDTARFGGAGALNDDDHLTLEFTAPRALYTDTAESNWRLVRSHRGATTPEVTPDSRGELERAETHWTIGNGYLGRGMAEDALASFERARTLDPGYVPAVLGASASRLRLGEARQAREEAEKALALAPDNALASYLAGLACQVLGDRTQALEYLRRATTLEPRNAEFRQALESVARGSG